VSKKAIGIFDSGLGGITVLRSLCERFPHESFIYLGDIARLPYGNKSPETIRLYGLQIMRWLKAQDVKAIIIACNSASSVFLGENNFEGIPLFNVIEPGAKAVIDSGAKRVAVLGTSATIRSKAYSKTLHGLASDISVDEISCPLFVPLVEEGETAGVITQAVFDKYLSRLSQKKPEAVILGCTHYPMLRDALQKYFGDSTRLLESGEVLSSLVAPYCEEEGSRRVRLCITDLTDHFERLAREFLEGQTIDSLEKVIL
jgi:glutamate racemase